MYRLRISSHFVKSIETKDTWDVTLLTATEGKSEYATRDQLSLLEGKTILLNKNTGTW